MSEQPPAYPQQTHPGQGGPGAATGYYGPPQGQYPPQGQFPPQGYPGPGYDQQQQMQMQPQQPYYGQQQMPPQQGYYAAPGQQPVYQDDRGRNDSSGCLSGCLAAMACCCCLDMLF